MGSDELVVALWCWVNYPDFDGDDRDDVADAEAIMVDRGYAEKYGRALVIAVFGVDGWGPRDELWSGEDFAKLATAPIEARVKALAAVIRGLP